MLQGKSLAAAALFGEQTKPNPIFAKSQQGVHCLAAGEDQLIDKPQQTSHYLFLLSGTTDRTAAPPDSDIRASH